MSKNNNELISRRGERNLYVTLSLFLSIVAIFLAACAEDIYPDVKRFKKAVDLMKESNSWVSTVNQECLHALVYMTEIGEGSGTATGEFAAMSPEGRVFAGMGIYTANHVLGSIQPGETLTINPSIYRTQTEKFVVVSQSRVPSDDMYPTDLNFAVVISSNPLESVQDRTIIPLPLTKIVPWKGDSQVTDFGYGTLPNEGQWFFRFGRDIVIGEEVIKPSIMVLPDDMSLIRMRTRTEDVLSTSPLAGSSGGPDCNSQGEVVSVTTNEAETKYDNDGDPVFEHFAEDNPETIQEFLRKEWANAMVALVKQGYTILP